MFTLTLEINQKCNLKCSYCYLGEKETAEMSYEVAENVILIILKKIEKQDQRKRILKINFLGGEPLLSIALIQKLVNFCNIQSIERNVKIIYTITTNGTIINREILNFMINNNFGIKLSLDGREKVHDLNRKTLLNQGSFKIIENNFSFFAEYENRMQKYIQVANVVTHNNYMNMIDTLDFLSERGFCNIDTAFDSTYDWEDIELKVIEKMIMDNIERYIQYAVEGRTYWRLLYKINKSKSMNNRVYSCRAGINSCYVQYNGRIWPCPSAIGSKYEIFTRNGTIDNKSVHELDRMKHPTKQKCIGCSDLKWCRAQGCIINVDKGLCSTSKIGCWFTHLSRRIIHLYGEELENVFMC